MGEPAAPRRTDERLGPRAPGAAAELEPPLRGRCSELAAIGQHLDRMLSGAGAVVVIEGRAGMGKSRLLSEVARMAKRLSIRVGSGVADPGDTIVQLAPLMEALLEGPTPILERDALCKARTSPEQRYWLLQDIEALLERAALESPIVICLDDLQWTDAGTAAALRSLPRRLSTVPVGWFIAARPGPGSPEFRRVADHLEGSGAHKIVLAPLDETAVARIAVDVLLGDPDGALLDMAEHAGGNPFLLVEFLRGLRDEDLVRVHSGRAELVQPRVPNRVGESMRRRLERASDAARRVLTVAASLGRRFSLDELAAMLDAPPSNLLMPLEELTHGSVLVERDGKLAFLHDLTRDILAPADRPYLIAAAYLHDVGYAPALVDTGFHPIDGARHLRELGHERLADLVAYHSSAVAEAESRELANELRAFVQERSAAAEALTYCDMITSPSGAAVTFERRVEEVCQRYGEDDLVSRSIRLARPELAAIVERTEQRLRDAGVPSLQPM